MAGRQRALVTPAIPFGMSEHHMSLGGTLTLDYATMAAVIGCVVRSAARHGFERIFVLNGHGGNIAALDTIITELTIELKLPLAGGTYWYIAAESIRAFWNTNPNCYTHCEAETSIMQALSPELVAPLDPSMRGALVPGMSAIQGSTRNLRWQHLKTRSAIAFSARRGRRAPRRGTAARGDLARRGRCARNQAGLWEAPI